MKSFLRAAAASGLAAATIVSGIAVAPTAASAAASPELVTAPGVFQLDSTYFSLVFGDSSGRFRAEARSGLADAVAHAPLLTFPAPGTKGQVSDGKSCLVSFGSRESMLIGDCTDHPQKTFETHEVTVDGQKTYVLESAQGGFVRPFSASGTVPVVGGTADGAYTLPTVRPGLSGQVDKVDLAGRAADISGTAEPNADIVINDYMTTKADDDGKWSYHLTRLKLGSNPIKVEQFKDAEQIGEAFTFDVVLDVRPVTGTVAFADDKGQEAVLTGTGHPGAEIEVRNMEDDIVARATVNVVTGGWTTTLPAPDAPGEYDVRVNQVIDGERNGDHLITVAYGAAVTVTEPADGTEHDGGPLAMKGKGEPGALVAVHEEGDDTVIGTATVLVNGYWALSTDDLDAHEHILVVEQTGKGANVTRAEVTVNEGKSSFEPLEITSPKDGSVVPSETRRVAISGTAEPGAHVQILTQTHPARTVVDTYADGQGRWSGTGELAYDVAYTLDTVYTVPGQAPVTGTYSLTLVQPSTDAPKDVLSPTEGQSVSAPDRQVTITGTAPTGTRVTIWNWAGKDRQVAPSVVADAKGTWSTTATLNNQDTPYALHVEYLQGDTTTTQTRNITVTDGQGVTQPFELSSPAEGETVVAPDKLVPLSGKGTTGTQVKIWNWAGKDRLVADVTTIGADGTWSTTATLNNQDTAYALHVEYTLPDGTTQTLTRNITVTASDSVARPFEVTTPTEGQTVPAVGSERLVEIAGTGTTGGEVTVWNYKTHDRVVGTAIVDATGHWSLQGSFAIQDYAIEVEYDLDDQPTTTITRNFTVTQ